MNQERKECVLRGLEALGLEQALVCDPLLSLIHI